MRRETDATQPFVMDDAERVYLVERGYLDIFAVELEGDRPVGRRRFVTRVAVGEMAFGADRAADPARAGRVFGFLAVPGLDAVLIDGERAGVAAEGFDLAAVTWIDVWISKLSEFAVRGCAPPRNAVQIEADPNVSYPSGSVLSAQHGDVVWVSATVPMRLLGRTDLVAAAVGEPLLPLTEHTWLEIDADAVVTAVHTPTALLTEQLWPALLRFASRILERAILAEAEAGAALASRRRDANEALRVSVSGSLGVLGDVLGGARSGGGGGSTGGTALTTAVRLVAESGGATLAVQPSCAAGTGVPDGPGETAGTIEALARRSGIRTRRITLARRWWKRDGPSFVGFTTPGAKPLAVITNNRGGYRAADPETGADVVVNARTAAGIAAEGVALYPSLPDDAENARTVLRFALFPTHGDLRTVCAVGALAGLTALLVPLLVGQVLGKFIPRADFGSWVAALGGLALVGLGNAVFGVVQGLAVLRIEGRIDERLQAAIWSRLIALRAPFFRDFTAGDLADRAGSIGTVRQMLTGAVVQAAVSSLFSMFSLLLLFYYSWRLTLVVCAVLFVTSIATGFCSYRQLRHYRDMYRTQGAISGFAFQMINGLSKLRVANAATYALARWARQFSEQKRSALAARQWAAVQHALNGLFQPLALALIYGLVHYGGTPEEPQPALDLATFLSFNAAFGQLTAAVISLTIAATTAVSILPLLERVRPILAARPENADGGGDPGDLRGGIEFANVTFRYGSHQPNAVDDVSFRIDPGEYVAFVGPSGCGKSTLFRLLLGFEQPASGSVFLDGHDLSGLDRVAVRRCMGVVPQNGQLVAGNIYENIAGMSPLGAEGAWEAVRAAALDEDIRAMPMRMRTVVTSHGSGLSAGQKQRLLIARALARRPRILLLDEATSALDNRAQAAVQASIRKLSATRVVIAHRLSSIRDVDRIFVMDRGRIVESGRYDDLMRRGGLFAALSRRQIVQS